MNTQVFVRVVNAVNYLGQWLMSKNTYSRPVNALETAKPQPYRLAGLRFWWHPPTAFEAQIRHPNYVWWKAPYWLVSWCIALLCTCYLLTQLVQYNFNDVIIGIVPSYRMYPSHCTFASSYGTTTILRITGACPAFSSCSEYKAVTSGSRASYRECERTLYQILGSLLYHAVNILLILSQGYCIIRYFPHFGAFTRAFLLSNKTSNVELKREFRSVTVAESSFVAVAHSHPKAAALRNNADAALNAFLTLRGFTPYSIQLSHRDILNGVGGSLIHYHLQDQHAPERSDRITPEHIFKLVNVDYYIDWVQYLWMGMPFVLYTFTPYEPCGQCDEYMWTTNLDNTITMTHTGGGVYRHQLWSYMTDHIVARYPGLTITYDVEINRIHKHWSLVLIVPKTVTAASPFQRSSCSLQRQQLIVQSPTICTVAEANKRNEKNKILLASAEVVPCALITHSAPEVTIAISKPGLYASLVMDAKLRATLDARMESKQLSIADLSNLLSINYGNDMRFAAAMVYTAYPYGVRVGAHHTQKYSARDLAVSYGKVDASFDPQRALTGLVLCNPILDSGFLPWRSKPNERWTSVERIEAVRNYQVHFNDKYLKYAGEFIVRLVPRKQSLVPLEVSDVMLLQNRPSQRINNLAAETNLATWLERFESQVKSFQKSEVYPAPKDPRNITTLPSEHCLMYSTFTLPFADVLKQTEWYVFGIHPDTVAMKVHELCSKSQTVTETDFSRFDGTHSFALYKLELALLLHCYDPMWHATITKIHHSMTSASARMSLGTMYTIGGSRLSGSADTSCMNSVDNAFVSYCAYRDMGYESVDAYSRLGLYGGDDGLTGDVNPSILERVCSDLGLKMKAISRPSHCSTSLLGRKYPRPHSSPGHMADLPRQLSKLHICPSRDPRIAQNPWIGLYNKASGYIATDRDTPILGAWCKAVLRLAPESARQEMLDLQQYTVRIYSHQESKYAPSLEARMEQACSDLDLSSSEITMYETRIMDCNTPEELLELPCIRGYLGKIPNNVQVGDLFGEITPEVSAKVPEVKDPGDAQVPVILCEVDLASSPIVKNSVVTNTDSKRLPIAVATPVVTAVLNEPVVSTVQIIKPRPIPVSAKCTKCNKEFVLATKELEFFRNKNLATPKRCKSCRATRPKTRHK